MSLCRTTVTPIRSHFLFRSVTEYNVYYYLVKLRDRGAAFYYRYGRIASAGFTGRAVVGQRGTLVYGPGKIYRLTRGARTCGSILCYSRLTIMSLTWYGARSEAETRDSLLYMMTFDPVDVPNKCGVPRRLKRCLLEAIRGDLRAGRTRLGLGARISSRQPFFSSRARRRIII